MANLIDRAAANAALEKLDELMRHRAETEDKEFVKVQVGITLARCEIDAAPTVEAEPVVHARWKHKDNSRNITRIGDFEEWYECSACFGSAEWMSERCPHCGAHMDADAPARAEKGWAGWIDFCALTTTGTLSPRETL